MDERVGMGRGRIVERVWWEGVPLAAATPSVDYALKDGLIGWGWGYGVC